MNVCCAANDSSTLMAACQGARENYRLKYHQINVVRYDVGEWSVHNITGHPKNL